MHEVIQKLLETEAEAKRLVSEAHAKAELIVSEARAKAGELTVQRKRDAQREGELTVQRAVEQAKHEKRAQLQAATATAEAQLKLDPAAAERLVAASLRVVCGIQ